MLLDVFLVNNVTKKNSTHNTRNSPGTLAECKQRYGRQRASELSRPRSTAMFTSGPAEPVAAAAAAAAGCGIDGCRDGGGTVAETDDAVDPAEPIVIG